ncbi:hypothetical protein Mapa_004329 [Marchantia paleacea]|nr:hypothetical protein Mapa_004329 [Marchantia paleacea]
MESVRDSGGQFHGGQQLQRWRAGIQHQKLGSTGFLAVLESQHVAVVLRRIGVGSARHEHRLGPVASLFVQMLGHLNAFLCLQIDARNARNLGPGLGDRQVQESVLLADVCAVELTRLQIGLGQNSARRFACLGVEANFREKAPQRLLRFVEDGIRRRHARAQNHHLVALLPSIPQVKAETVRHLNPLNSALIIVVLGQQAVPGHLIGVVDDRGSSLEHFCHSENHLLVRDHHKSFGDGEIVHHRRLRKCYGHLGRLLPVRTDSEAVEMWGHEGIVAQSEHFSRRGVNLRVGNHRFVMLAVEIELSHCLQVAILFNADQVGLIVFRHGQ